MSEGSHNVWQTHAEVPPENPEDKRTVQVNHEWCFDIYIYIYICTYTNSNISLSLYIYIYMCVYTSLSIYMYTYIYIYISLSLDTYIYIYCHRQRRPIHSIQMCGEKSEAERIPMRRKSISSMLIRY